MSPFVLFAAAYAADVSVPWQARLLDPSGSPLQGNHDVEITLYDGSTPIWRKQYAGTPAAGGYVSVVLSGPDDLAATPLDSKLFAANLLVGVRVGTAAELSPRMALGAVPRAASVRGPIIAEDLPMSCTAAIHGAIRWTGTSFEGCTPSGWQGIGASSVGTPSNPGLDCQAIHEANAALPSATYTLDPDGTGGNPSFTGYCDMSTDGGGWTLLLTLMDPHTQYSGSVSPFTQALNVASPSPTSAWSRNWTGTFAPLPGHEFLIKRSDGEFVRFVQGGAFCGWGNTSTCNGAGTGGGHYHYTQGQAYDSSGAQIDRIAYFNACAGAGTCATVGADAPGISDFEGWPYGVLGNRAYGGGFGSDGNAHFYWGVTNTVSAATSMTYWYRRGTQPSVANGTRPDVAAASCKAIHLLDDGLPSGIYWIDPDGSAGNPAFPARCDMTTDDGGWTLLLTLTHPRDQYAGSVSPFANASNPWQPSTTTAYSRDWRNVITPAAGTEFLLKRNDGPWVRFVETAAFCGWANTATCNGVDTSGGHGHYTQGQLYNSGGGAISGHTYFNGCFNAGGCGSSGSDAPGFGNYGPWSQGTSPQSTYGTGWSSASISYFFWGNTIEANTPFTWWVR